MPPPRGIEYQETGLSQLLRTFQWVLCSDARQATNVVNLSEGQGELQHAAVALTAPEE
jgi:hypothetical protein